MEDPWVDQKQSDSEWGWKGTRQGMAAHELKEGGKRYLKQTLAQDLC